jgi:epoxyqueuosine reductase
MFRPLERGESLLQGNYELIKDTVRKEAASLAEAVKFEARRLGFDLAGIAPAVTPSGFSALTEWIAQGFAGTMQYLPNREAAYEHPKNVLDGVKSLVVLGANYRTKDPPEIQPGEARVSRYAWGTTDYHDLLRDRLQRLGDFLHAQKPGCRTRGAVDTAPLLERDFARLAGLGWFGKNTMLINKHAGSWLFLSVLLTDLELAPDEPHDSSHCGTCTRCLEACPTDAFPEPYVLDARRCISYLTIELREPVPIELREGVGDWLFGCDICQDVCPWNHKAPLSQERAFEPEADRHPADALEILQLNEQQFPRRFGKTALARPQRAGLLRNAAIVLGNQKPDNALPVLISRLDDQEPLIRGAVAWALGRYDSPNANAALSQRLTIEEDANVIKELNAALRILE